MDCFNCNKCEMCERYSWRFECRQCHCANYLHNSYVQKQIDSTHDLSGWVDQITTTNGSQLGDYRNAMRMAKDKFLTWLPIGVGEKNVSKFVEAYERELGLLDNKANKLQRATRIAFQIPVGDRNVDFDSTKVDKEFDPISECEFNFMKGRDSDNLGFGELEEVDYDETCFKCQRKYTDSDDFCVRITHAGTISWHVTCFKCQKCQDSLADFHYYWSNERKNIYCMRHFGEIMNYRCAGCDKLIFQTEFTQASGKDYHSTHLACIECNQTLIGGKFIVKDNHFLCMLCYENVYASICERCGTKISYDSKDIIFKNRHWHEKCFYCDICRTNLSNQSFATKDEGLYCSNCNDENFGDRCNGCNQPFKGGVKKLEYASKYWHEDCFVCDICKRIPGPRFIPKEDKIICIQCYDDKFAQRCTKCREAIMKGGVTYKSEPWHKECFLCTKCNKQLANTKFTSKDDKPYCNECFTDVFSKLCKKCGKPISVFHAMFVSVDEDDWHSECFTCTKCNENLMDKGFMNSNLVILCPRCALYPGNN